MSRFGEQSLYLQIQSVIISHLQYITERDQKLMWLKEQPDNDMECRMLTNARCLSEGVDVPSLDAVVFVSPKN